MNQQLEWVYGLHTCEALLKRHPERILKAYCLDSRQDTKLQNIIHALEHLDISITIKNRSTLDNLINSAQHQGIALQCRAAQIQDNNYLKKILTQLDKPAFLLILDGITDPHNLGACIRSAEAAGADAVIIPKNRAVGLTATARKVACGAAEILPIISVTNLAQCFQLLKDQGVWIYGAAGEASASIYQTNLCGHLALVMGSEGEGLRHLTRELCDGLIHIPMHGHTNSLNVSVATGICLFEAQRQRQKNTYPQSRQTF